MKEKEIIKILNGNSCNKEKLIEDIKNIPLCKIGKSVPIGNMSSQAFAIIYLNELDHFIKKDLKPGFYIRYQDDGILISNSKKFLSNCLKSIDKIVKKYKLILNKKTRIYSIDEGFEFLGFRYYKKNNKLIVKVKNQTKRKFKRKMKMLYKLYINNKLQLSKIESIKASYLGHLKYGYTKKLIKNTIIIYQKDLYDDFGKTIKINEKGETV